MHYGYFDFQHTWSDGERAAFLQNAFEQILTHAAEGSGRKISRLLRFLRESDFYRIPCRHHPFAGGNAWHQLETYTHALAVRQTGYALNGEYRASMPQWLGGDPLGIAITALLHDIGNVQGMEYPPRILRRHGRKSTYVLVDYLKFDLMFDENMSIIHHQEKDLDTLRDNCPTEEDAQRIWEMPLYQMVRHCDAISCECRMTESELRQHTERILSALQKTIASDTPQTIAT